MENKSDGCEFLKTDGISSLKDKLCKLKHSGKHIKESLEAQQNMSSGKRQYMQQQTQPQEKNQPHQKSDGIITRWKKCLFSWIKG